MTESGVLPFQGSLWLVAADRAPLAGPRPAGSAALVGTGQRRASGSVVEALPQKPGARRPGAGAATLQARLLVTLPATGGTTLAGAAGEVDSSPEAWATERPEALIPECVGCSVLFFWGLGARRGGNPRRGRGCARFGRIFLPLSLTFGVARAAWSCRVSGASWGSTSALCLLDSAPAGSASASGDRVGFAETVALAFPFSRSDPCWGPCFASRPDPAPLPREDLETS